MTRAPTELLSELVAIASPSGAEGPAADWVVAECARAGVACERHGESVVVRVGDPARGPRLLLNSHLDTVPVGAGWDGDPLDGAWRGGRLVARGANDAKASAVAMLWAALELARAEPLPGELLVALNALEETTNRGMEDVLAAVGTPDAAITGEPTGLAVVRAQAGLAVLEAAWEGRSCHAAHVARVEHASALHAAVRDLAGIEPWFALPGEHPLLGPSTVACTVLRAGERHNVVPDRAEALFDARLAPNHTAAECAERLARELPGARVRVRSERLRPIETAAEHPLVVACLAAAGRAAAVGSSTLSDMALLQGVPVVKCGPGETARSHTPNEYVTEDELLAGCAFYRAVVPSALARLQPRAAGARA